MGGRNEFLNQIICHELYVYQSKGQVIPAHLRRV